MKRYGIPLLVIIILATAAYAWRSSVAKREFIRHQRKAHIDSLRTYHPDRTRAVVPGSDSGIRIEMPALSGLWDLRKLAAMPDSIRPEDFQEQPISVVLSKGYFQSDRTYISDSDSRLDTLATLSAMFVDSTVIKMLKCHVIPPVDVEDFNRCPTGLYAVSGFDLPPVMTEMDGDDDTVSLKAAAPPSVDRSPWNYGGVYLGQGCDDTLVARYRIQYRNRIVEMKDPNAAQYVSLRTYELMKFGRTMAAMMKPKD